MQTIMADRRNPVNDFFGGIFGGIQEGLSRVGSEVLPNWVSKQLGMQTRDQLADSTYQDEYARRRLDSPIEGAEPRQKVLFDIGGIQVTSGTLIVMGALFIAAIVIFKKVL